MKAEKLKFTVRQIDIYLKIGHLPGLSVPKLPQSLTGIHL